MRTSTPVTALVLALLAAPALAEDDTTPPRGAEFADCPAVTFGPRAVASVSDLEGSSDVDAGSLALEPSLGATTGGGGGAFVTIALNDWLGIQVEALVERRGASAEGALPGAPMGAPPFTVDYQLVYANVPVLARFDVPYDGRFTPRAYAGAVLGYELRAHLEGNAFLDDGMGGFVPFEAEADIGDTNPFQVGAVAGLGVGFPLPRGHLAIDVRYEIGITNVIDDDTSSADGITVTSSGVRQRVLSVGLAWEVL